jgi:hypothetical protein
MRLADPPCVPKTEKCTPLRHVTSLLTAFFGDAQLE